MAGALVGLRFVDNLMPFTSIKSICRRLGEIMASGALSFGSLWGQK
jgi:hypothetical protein